MARTMFERYGGFAKVSRVVSTFYDRVLDSPVASPFFSRTDMRRLIDHQTKFLSFLMGGPASYTHEHLERVHQRLGITDAAFQEVLFLLRETLEDFDFEEEDIKAIEDDMAGYRHHIVAKA